MAKIAVLPPHLVNKIAAGEVIERPASVLKELLENSLDAGAARITVEIEDGGRKLIRITDNGCGMTAEDLALSCEPHATSKIHIEDDLYAIRTLGFRGEALASIASVSQMEIVSRQADSLEGAKLEINGIDRGAVAPSAAAPGTVIAVRNLFFNTPARRKFLRTANTEMAHISEQFSRIALANTDIHMTLHHNGRLLYDLPAGQTLTQRVAALFSGELAESLLPVKRSGGGVEVWGMIAAPRFSVANAQTQYVFLNGRYIRDKFIGHAIREAYRGLMDPNRYPAAFVFLKMDPGEVDFNVHPSKVEVRFANSNAVHSQVLAALRDRLLSTDLSVPLGSDTLNISGGGNLFGEPETAAGGSSQQSIRQAMADFFKSHPAPSEPHSLPSRDISIPRDAPTPTEIPVHTPFSRPLAAIETFADNKRPEPIAKYRYSAADSEPDAEPSGRFLQVHNSYLVTESNDGILIIDQHALHERVIYEQLTRQLEAGPLPCQRCLIPETLEVTDSQMAAWENSQPLLQKLGILAEPFGPRTLAIQGFPPVLDAVSSQQFLRDLLQRVAGAAGPVEPEHLMHEILDMMACKAAVKAGDSLNDQEIASLLRQRAQVERSSNCPHGRPTTLRLTLDQLAKQFKRT